MPYEGVTALLAGLAPVLIFQGLQLNLQGVEDRMVFVHRSVATVTILTESEDFSALPSGPLGPRRHPRRLDASPAGVRTTDAGMSPREPLQIHP